MKTSTTLVLLFSLFSVGICQTNWYSQTSGTDKPLTDVCFIDENTGWISGWTGTILHTTDGGASWTPQNPPPNNAYWSLSFINSLNGWASGYGGKIVRTTDGGASWVDQNTPTNYDLFCIRFTDFLNGWAVGGDPGGFPSGIDHRIILRTTNAGTTWITQYAVSYEAPLKSIYPINDQLAYATGDGGALLKTSDGGTNWMVQTINSSFHFYDIFFVKSTTGWVCGEYLGVPHYAAVFKTTDGGASWTEKQLGTDESLQGIFFINDMNGWTVGSNNSTDNVIYHTTDGGASWTNETTPGILSLSRVFFINNIRGWAVGYLGTIASTFDPTAGLDLDLKVFLEGPFTSTEMGTQLNAAGEIPLSQPYGMYPWNYAGNESVAGIPNSDVVDWILVEVRDATSAATATSATRVARQAAFLLKDGSIVDLDGFSNLHIMATIMNDPYIVIWHRNHLGILSALPPTPVGNIYTLDFSTGADKVFGGLSGYKLISGSVYGMVGGDKNSDGMISTADKTAWAQDAGKTGFQSSDMDLNGQTGNIDKNDVWFENVGLSSQVPD